MRKLYCFLIFYISLTSTFPQVLLKQEQVNQGSYRLVFENTGYSYEITNQGKKSYLTLTSLNESSDLPRKDLFIAIPVFSNPVIRFYPIKQKLLSGVELSKRTVSNFSSPIDHANQHTLEGNKFSKVNGFLWIGNNYCVHISVYPYHYGDKGEEIVELSEFAIELRHPDFINIPVKEGGDKQLSTGLIINSQCANLWKANAPEYNVSQTDSWIDYTQEYLKLGVARDGIYRLTYNDLMGYNVPVSSLDPKKIKLYLKGKEIPIYVSGDQNQFTSADYIEFLGRRNYGDEKYREPAPYGSPYYEYLNRYSDTTIYWLSWSGVKEGIRVDTTLSYGSLPSDTLHYYEQLSRIEDNRYFDFSLNGDDVRKNNPEILENETWNEGSFGVGKYSKLINVSNLFLGKPARVYVKLQTAASNASAFQDGAHKVSLQINSIPTVYDSGSMKKFQVKTLVASLNSNQLNNGINTLHINSYPNQFTLNTLWVDWWEIEYPRYLRTTNEVLTFGYSSFVLPKFARVAIKGFSTNAYSLYRFSLVENAVQKITTSARSSDTVRFVDSVKAGIVYFISSHSKIAAPIIFYKKKFVNLRSSTNRADYIAITHPYFFTTTLTEYLSFVSLAYGVKTKLIDVNDIYDEFNYGFFAPEPIREFLKTTHTMWSNPAPAYVFLIGKGTYDFYGNKTKYQGAPRITNFVPSYGTPVADNWFVMWDTTNAFIPQMNIGRLPVQNLEEFQSYFLRHKNYTAKGYDDWNKRYLFFSGGNLSTPGQIEETKKVNDFIIQNFVSPAPIGGAFHSFYKTSEPLSDFGPYSIDFVRKTIDEGGVFISYIGHSAVQTWDNSITKMSDLANSRDRYPLITDFGCSTAKFAEPDIVSFSELAVSNITGQAIAYIGNSAFGFTSTAFHFPQVFYKKLLDDTLLSVGEIHRQAKLQFLADKGTSSTYGLFSLTNMLVGDPIVKLPIPQLPSFTFTNSTLSQVPDQPTELTDSVVIRVGYKNLGKVFKDSVEYLISYKYNNVIVSSYQIKRRCPLLDDTINIPIPVKNKPGGYAITVTIDPANLIDEIYENDNSFTYDFIVANSSIRTVGYSPYIQQIHDTLTFLNPTILSQRSSFFVDVSLDPSFNQKKTYQVPIDTFSTQLVLEQTYNNKRIWIQTKYDPAGIPGLISSYFNGEKENIFFHDSVSFQKVTTVGAKVQSNTIVLDTSITTIRAISAGSNDGNTALITKNGESVVPDPLKTGYHVCLFDAGTYEFKFYKLFDIVNKAGMADTFKIFLDALSPNYIVAIALSNIGSGSNLSTALKSSIKSIGSRYIDSVKSVYSWAIIGRKGAVPGSVPEKFSKTFEGRVDIDTIILSPNIKGLFTVNEIGPVANWKNSELKYSKSVGSSIEIKILGINDAVVDTLSTVSVSDSIIDFSTVNAEQYPYIKLNGELSRTKDSPSPSISSVAINYDALPELGTNYQTVRLYQIKGNNVSNEIFPSDTVLQGEKVKAVFRVYNVGGVAVKNVGAKINAVWDNNTNELVSSFLIDSLVPKTFKEFSAIYNTGLGFGKRNFQISIDPDTTVKELYRDNNFYSFPIIVKKNESSPLLPNLAVAQTGIIPKTLSFTDRIDTAQFTIVYTNTGALVNDSISISVKHLYKNLLAAQWTMRRKYPSAADTLSVSVPILKRAGEHQLQVELDPIGLIVESSESDNSAIFYFTVATSAFTILQPTQFTVSAVSQIIFLNPTTAAFLSQRLALLDIDTLSSFATAQSMQIPMQEFTTTYDISSRKKQKRYYWRIKEVNSSNEWTAGSFYLGNSSSFTLGQIDSLSWAANTFNHVRFTPDSGARIVDTRFFIEAYSAGFNDGNNGSIKVNGINVVASIFGNGHNIVVLDTVNYQLVQARRFNISNNPSEADSLVQFISVIPKGSIVVDVVVDEGANNLTTQARNALKTIGSAFIDQLSFHDSWAIIGRKGAAIGSLPELYKPQGTGSAVIETTFVRKETSGMILTAQFGSFARLSTLSLNSVIPPGSQLVTKVLGISAAGKVDTVASAMNANSISLQTFDSKSYPNAQLMFDFQSTSSQTSPRIYNWTVSGIQPVELAVSAKNTNVSSDSVLEGENIQFSTKVFNVGAASVDSITVQIKTTQSGIETILKKQIIPIIAAQDSFLFSYVYDSRGKRGNRAFIFEIDPENSTVEVNKNNNSVTVPFRILSDSMKPSLRISFDGLQIVNGDYVSQYPEIRILYTDNNPSMLLPTDTSNFIIKLNGNAVSFTPGTAELINTSSAGKAEIRWTPELTDGDNYLEIFALDVAGNSSDTLTAYVKVASQFRLMDVYNIPNPFNNATHFTFNLGGPITPEEVIIRIYTVAGRLIHEINQPAIIGFNKIFWDGRDKDGDEIGNGVYLYRVVVKHQEKQVAATSKLVKMK